MKIRRLKSVTSDKLGDKIADFRAQITILTDEVETLKKQNEELCKFQSLIEGTVEESEFFLLELLDKLKKQKDLKKKRQSLQ